MNTDIYGNVIGGGKKSPDFCCLRIVQLGLNSAARLVSCSLLTQIHHLHSKKKKRELHLYLAGMI